MKTLVLSALMATTLSTSVSANMPHAAAPKHPAEARIAIDKKADAFKAQIEMLQWNVDVSWDQYERAIDGIKNKQGSVSSLIAEMNSLIRYYQNDIDQGLRVEASKEAIAEIREMYGKKIKKQNKAESRQIARMQALLEAALDKEEQSFKDLKRTHAAQINDETRSLVRSAERQFALSAARIEALKGAMAFASL